MKNPFQIKQHVKQIFIPPSSPSYHPTITGLRALGFLSITALHCLYFGSLALDSDEDFDKYAYYHPLGLILNSGSGVDVFLLLSGFLMFESMFKSSSINVVSLLLNRAWRLLPAIAFTTILLGAAGNKMCPHYEDFIFCSNYGNIDPDTLSKNCIGWNWSVSVDFQCWAVIAVIFFFLTKTKSRASEWKITVKEIVGLIIILTIINLWEAFLIDPYVPSTLRFSAFLNPSSAANMQKEFSNIKIRELGSSKTNPLMYFYYTIPSRLSPFLYGLLAAQIYYKQNQYISHLHKWSFVYLPLALILTLSPLPFTPPSSTYLSALPYLPRNIAIALTRQIFAAGVTLFLLLSISSEKKNKKNEKSISPVGKLTAKFFGLYLWYPISQLSYIAYVSMPFVMVITLMAFLPSNITTLYLFQSLFLTLIPLLIFSAIIYIFYEQPILEVKKLIFPSRLQLDAKKKN